MLAERQLGEVNNPAANRPMIASNSVLPPLETYSDEVPTVSHLSEAETKDETDD